MLDDTFYLHLPTVNNPSGVLHPIRPIPAARNRGLSESWTTCLSGGHHIHLGHSRGILTLTHMILRQLTINRSVSVSRMHGSRW